MKLYSASDLLLATNSFNERNFLGSSLFGSTYRADFPGGQVFIRIKYSIDGKKNLDSSNPFFTKLCFSSLVTTPGYI